MKFLDKLKEINQIENIHWSIYFYTKRQSTKTNPNPYVLFSCNIDSSLIEYKLISKILENYKNYYNKNDVKTEKYSPGSSKFTIDFIPTDDKNDDENNDESNHIRDYLTLLNTSISKAKKYDSTCHKINGYLLKGVYHISQQNTEEKVIYFIKTGTPLKTMSKKKFFLTNEYKLKEFNPEHIELSDYIDCLIYDNDCYITTVGGQSFWYLENYNKICRNNFIEAVTNLNNLIQIKNIDVNKFKPTSNAIYTDILSLNDNVESALLDILNDTEIVEWKRLNIEKDKIIINTPEEYEILLNCLAYRRLSRGDKVISTTASKIIE